MDCDPKNQLRHQKINLVIYYCHSIFSTNGSWQVVYWDLVVFRSI